ncbi:hypothetical protein N7456_006214 [Penicillium angulare]|uniref:FAD-binding PCMH-type domain-containing protein n=1 Tax=Penicillium angulare TaxID=116970 RepID=A0A9W9FZW7_9EURO|nr:hypothetical protein N7456_006214 [Penicillium angulare]
MKTWLAITVALASTVLASESQCRCFPGDSCWPSLSDWSALNKTVGGRLIATVPIGTPCHNPTYNGAACDALQANWTLPQTHLDSSSSVMQTYFANQSCDAFTPKSKPCWLGNYANYAVNVSSSDDVISAIQFASEKNIRFVIRNTGHDYLGRSTGAGALSVWMHHLNEIEYHKWSNSTYNGPAFKVGAGVLGYQILEAASSRGLVVVTGECPTVGLAGGYTQGGGHSALSTAFGLAADQTLEFEVVTATGKLVIASPSENPDLFWALSGGGAGNYGVVISMTVKAHPDTTIGGAALQFTATGTSPDNFFKAVSLFHHLLPRMIDSGVTVIYQMASGVFAISPVTGYNKTSEDIKSILRPFLLALDDLNITSKVGYTQFDSYYEHYNKYMGPLPYGNLAVSSYQYGGRLIPRQVLQNNSTGLSMALRNLTDEGVIVVGVGMDVSHPENTTSNAVFPALRRAAITMQIGTAWNETAPWSKMISDQWKITNDYVPQLEALTPDGGCYQNEANFRQPRWKQTFFGSNYSPLSSVKRKWDPESFFYVLKGVGSDSWNVSNSGRMCQRKSK